jgi:hypothetical protein
MWDFVFNFLRVLQTVSKRLQYLRILFLCNLAHIRHYVFFDYSLYNRCEE